MSTLMGWQIETCFNAVWLLVLYNILKIKLYGLNTEQYLQLKYFNIKYIILSSHSQGMTDTFVGFHLL